MAIPKQAEYLLARKRADDLLNHSDRDSFLPCTVVTPAVCSTEDLATLTSARSQDHNRSHNSVLAVRLTYYIHEIEKEYRVATNAFSQIFPTSAPLQRSFFQSSTSTAPSQEGEDSEYESNIVLGLTHIIFPDEQKSGDDTIELDTANKLFKNFGASLPKKVCQHPFKKNDIVWVCRTCQADETCVLCHQCYDTSNHEGHDVAFYHAQAGGCCDCGDKDAWDPKGFCPLHGKEDNVHLEEGFESRVRGVVDSCVEHLGYMASNIDIGYRRANSSVKRKYGRSSTFGDLLTSPDPSMTSRPLQRSNTLASDGQVFSGGTLSTTNVDNPSSHGSPMDISSQHSPDTSLVDSNMTASVLYDDDASMNDDKFRFDPVAASRSKSRGTPKQEDQIDTSNHEAFNPEAASTSKSRNPSERKKHTLTEAMSPAQLLGLLGSEQHGLYLVIHADDIHKPNEIKNALRSLYYSFPTHSERNIDSQCERIARMLSQHIGDLIVLGNEELMEELGPILASCWKDRDITACTRFGALMLEKAKILTSYGLIVSIKTRLELCKEVKCAALLQFLSIMSKSCDPLCHIVTIGLGAKDSRDSIQTTTDAGSKITVMKDALGNCVQLVSMLQSDLKLPRKIASPWHDLLLTLLAVSDFKGTLANAYVDTYRIVTGEYAHGVGIFERSSYTLSVQFLNRVTYVEDLVRSRDLLFCLVRSLYEILLVALKTKSETMDETVRELRLKSAGDRSAMLLLDDYLSPLALGIGLPSWRGMFSKHNPERNSSEIQKKISRFNPVLDPLHPVLAHRRYGPCISDLKCVLNVHGISRLLASLPNGKFQNGIFNHDYVKPCLLDAWIDALSLGQNMDGQIWRRKEEGHVEQEPLDWVGAFNTAISIGSLFERFLQWEDEDENADSLLFHEYKTKNTFLSAVEMTMYILTTGLNSWQNCEYLVYLPSSDGSDDVSCPVCLPMSSVAVQHGCCMAMKALSLPQTKTWSFHLPLHRFVATCIREVSRRPYQSKNGMICGIDELISRLKIQHDAAMLERLYMGLLEFPMIVLSRNAQIRSDLWLRNGRGMSDQVLNYAEPPFCRILRDADLVLVQFAAIALFDLKNCNFAHQRPSPFFCSHLVHLLIHRFGIFEYSGLIRAAEVDQDTYFREILEGRYPPEKQGTDSSSRLPWSYSPSLEDPGRSKSMLEEFLLIVIILITELISPPPLNADDHTRQAKHRLRREVIHRLASGPKAHSELAEIHHVLPMRDNIVLSEAGKLVNPDDATGAALEAVLVEVAECKTFQGKSDQWELQRWAWNEYDPAFFHVSQRNHQNASENRSQLFESKNEKKIRAIPYIPFPPLPHKSFRRLRRDMTSDASLIAILYRALHVHCRQILQDDSFLASLGQSRSIDGYLSDSMSEIIVSRVIHLLSLGAYAWEVPSDEKSDSNWRIDGGGDLGSVFYNCTETPSPQKWVESILLAKPEVLMSSEKYCHEESMLLLLRKLAYEGGSNQFQIGDPAIRCGAAWLCEYATRHSSTASSILGKNNVAAQSETETSGESDLQRRRREAKERIMKRMQLNMATFASSIEIGENTDDALPFPVDSSAPSTPSRPISEHAIDHDEKNCALMSIDSHSETCDSPNVEKVAEIVTKCSSDYLFHNNPRCIICAEDNLAAVNSNSTFTDSSKGAKRRVLCFCGYMQASTVLKCGGGLPGDYQNQASDLVGSHIAFCGHAVHLSCCEAHIRDSAERDDRLFDRLDTGKWSEFKCPMCRRLSNCLIPFVNVKLDWTGMRALNFHKFHSLTLEEFLNSSKWWTCRNDRRFAWDNRCSFLPVDPSNDNATSIQYFGKKTLYRSWVTAFSSSFIPFFTSNDDIFSAHNANALVELWRKFLDQISDCTYKGDHFRFGESRLQENVGEFRHYVAEKLAYNDFNAANYGFEAALWPMCISPILTNDQKQVFSREKLVSRLLQAIQSFTYSCCSEFSECLRLWKKSTYSNRDVLITKFGIDSIVCDDHFITLQKPHLFIESSQIFDGRAGKLRYFALPLIYTSGSLTREIIHLTMNMPIQKENLRASDGTKRAPIVYPILRGHALTHTVAALTALCGDERKRCSSGDANIDVADNFEIIQETFSVIQLGFTARILQILLGTLREKNCDVSVIEADLIVFISMHLNNKNMGMWERGCFYLLHSAISPHIENNDIHKVVDDSWNEVLFQACETAKQLGRDFLCCVGFILQILLPKAIVAFESLKNTSDLECETLEMLMSVFQMPDFCTIVSYPLISEVVSNWYLDSLQNDNVDDLERRLMQSRPYEVYDWPNAYYEDPNVTSNIFINDKKIFPLFRGKCYRHDCGKVEVNNCIQYIPSSYTDLYAALGKIHPDTELIAVCLVCGMVLDANGKGECTKHTFQCGGGCGIFFLLQECICLAIYKDKAAYLPSPYVDSHGETPQFRGRPLNVDPIRYDFLHELWSGHTLREHIISERQKATRNLLINANYF